MPQHDIVNMYKIAQKEPKTPRLTSDKYVHKRAHVSTIPLLKTKSTATSPTDTHQQSYSPQLPSLDFLSLSEDLDPNRPQQSSTGPVFTITRIRIIHVDFDIIRSCRSARPRTRLHETAQFVSHSKCLQSRDRDACQAQL